MSSLLDAADNLTACRLLVMVVVVAACWTEKADEPAMAVEKRRKDANFMVSQVL